jgi:serpin B
MQMFQKALTVFLLLFCVVPHLYSGDTPSADLEQVVKVNDQFAIDLYSQLKDKEGNLFFSPYSISTTLAMTYGGARGNTAKEMSRTLHFTLSQKIIPSAFAKLQTELNEIQKQGKVLLYVANSLWPQRGYPFRQDYLSLMNKDYGVSITPVDYAKASDEARKIINMWVENNTKDTIKDLIRKGDLDRDTVLVLVNAIYFKGNWASQFDPELTKMDDFILPDGKKQKVPMMKQTNTFGLRESEEAQVLELPYVGNQLSMFIILPREANGLQKIENALSEDNLQSWLSRLPRDEVRVYLPKFKITWGTFELNKPLIALGIKDAFSSARADFSGMDGTRALFISLVLHKAFVEVNEEGTEAAAATAVVMKKGESQPHVFRADHPFLFLIRNNTTESILFLGRVIDPSIKGK